jgi:hypothetical protein
MQKVKLMLLIVTFDFEFNLKLPFQRMHRKFDRMLEQVAGWVKDDKV